VKIKQGAQRQAVMALVALAAGLSIAACGSSSNTSSPGSGAAAAGSATTRTTTAPANASAFAARRAKLEACLKSHGVTLPQRPAGGYGSGGYGGGYGAGAPGTGTIGGPGTGTVGGTGTATTPAPGTSTTGQGFHPRAGGGFFRRLGGTDSKFAQALKACGAQFGIGAGRFGGGRVGARFSKTTIAAFAACVKQHGYTLPAPNTSGTGPVFPRSIEANKKFQAAAKSCTGILRPAEGGYGGGAAGPGGNPPGASPPAAGGSSTTASA
jgi:hypothetical protein